MIKLLSAFYPTSGGQLHDIGYLIINNEIYDVIRCEKVGKCVLHYLNKNIDDSILSENTLV
jgi:alanyl-tRNA synthetase